MHKESSFQKTVSVVRVLFGTTLKKYPAFFAIESIKTVITIFKPFLAVMISPIIVDEIAGGKSLKKLMLMAALLIIGEFVLSLMLERCETVLGKYQARLDNYFGILIGRHAMELDFQLTEDKAVLDQLEKAKTGMDWYSGGVYGVAEQVFSFAGNVFKVVGFTVVIAMHAPLLLAVLAVYTFINMFFVTKQNRIGMQAFLKLSKVNRLFGYFGWEIVDPRYGKDIRLYEAQGMMLDSWKNNTEKSNAHWKWQADSQLPYALAMDATELVRGIFTFFYVALLALKGAYGVGTFIQLVTAENSLNETLGGLAGNIQELVKRCSYAYEYVLFMEYPAALTKGTRPIKKEPHEIEFRHVSFSYPRTNRKVLDDVSIKIKAGEHLSIVGLNGAGKTTFIKLLCRLYDPTEGEILLDGVNIKEYDYRQYMEQFAPVFQDFKLFAFTIKDNIVFEKRDEKTETQVQELIGKVGLAERVSGLSKGADTRLYKHFDEEGIEPSGGEQQKLAIARALYKDSPVVILDEPTAALDPLAEYEIYRQFNALVGGKTAFYISHRLSSCKFCDRIAVFSEGQIKEYGTHEQLERIPGGIYAEMFEAQAKYYRDAG